MEISRTNAPANSPFIAAGLIRPGGRACIRFSRLTRMWLQARACSA